MQAVVTACLTAMIATVSAEEVNIHETISTCRFSQRVAYISGPGTP
jgi:kinesin family protein 6/9